MEFEFHLQSPCGSPSTQLWDFRQSTRSGNERKCKKKHWKARANGNDFITNVISANQHFASTLSMQIFNFQKRSCKLSFLFPPRRQSGPESLLAGYYFLLFTETIMSLSPSPPPPSPPTEKKKEKENYITIVFTFSWVLQSCQEKSKTVVLQNFGSKQGALWSRWNCGWSQLINLNHNPARATPILYLCHGVFTDPFIFRQILGHFFPRKYRIHTRKTKRYLETKKKLGLKVLLTGLWNLKDIQNSRHWKPSKK